MSEVVVDASLVVEALIGDMDPLLLVGAIAPAHLRVEAASALRAMQRRGRLNEARAERAFDDLVDVSVRTWRLEPLLPTAWSLRQQFSIYDGLYVALSIHLQAPLATVDRRLARAAAEHCPIYDVN